MWRWPVRRRRHLGARVAAEVLGHSNFTMHVKSEIRCRAVWARRPHSRWPPLWRRARATHWRSAPRWKDTRERGGVVAGRLVVARAQSEVARSLELWRSTPSGDSSPSFPMRSSRRSRRVESCPNGALRRRGAQLECHGLLLAGLADHDAFVDGSMDDYLHQPYRWACCPSLSRS